MTARVRRAAPALALALAAAPAVAAAQPLRVLFDRATAAAARGEHEAALAGYDQLVEAGVRDADVFYDRATVHAFRGELGEAIRDFRAALALRPDDEDAARGLALAREALARARADREGEVEVEGSPAITLLAPVGEPALATAFLAFDVLFFAALLAAWRVRREVPRVAAGLAAALFAVGLLVTGGSLALRRGAFRAGEPAVVLGDATLLEGPIEGATARGALPEGASVEQLRREGAFVEVRAGETRGWLPATAVGLVGR